MTTNKRSKDTRSRAKTTHGYGSMKKHRGAGNRGGRGNAGSGKKGDCKAPIYRKIKKYFGKNFFASKTRTLHNPIKVSELDTLSEKLINDKKIKNSKVIELDLKSMGYTKLLGTGHCKKSYNITIGKATEKAIKRIESLEGSVALTKEE